MYDDDVETAAGLFFFTVAFTIMNRRKRGADGVLRRCWIHPINQVREVEGAWTVLVERFRIEFPDKHRTTIRVMKESFDRLVQYVTLKIKR